MDAESGSTSTAAGTTEPTPSDSRSAVAKALMRAAQIAFAENGYRATNVQEITERAGTSVGTLYYHFGGKSEIFAALYSEYTKRQSERVRQAIKLVRQAGVSDGRRLFLVGTQAYLTGSWQDRSMSRALVDGDAPRGFSVYSRRYLQEWEDRNSRLLGLDANPDLNRARLLSITGSLGAWTRAISEFQDAREAELFIDEALMMMGRIVGLDGYPELGGLDAESAD